MVWRVISSHIKHSSELAFVCSLCSRRHRLWCPFEPSVDFGFYWFLLVYKFARKFMSRVNGGCLVAVSSQVARSVCRGRGIMQPHTHTHTHTCFHGDVITDRWFLTGVVWLLHKGRSGKAATPSSSSLPLLSIPVLLLLFLLLLLSSCFLPATWPPSPLLPLPRDICSILSSSSLSLPRPHFLALLSVFLAACFDTVPPPSFSSSSSLNQSLHHSCICSVRQVSLVVWVEGAPLLRLCFTSSGFVLSCLCWRVPAAASGDGLFISSLCLIKGKNKKTYYNHWVIEDKLWCQLSVINNEQHRRSVCRFKVPTASRGTTQMVSKRSLIV